MGDVILVHRRPPMFLTSGGSESVTVVLRPTPPTGEELGLGLRTAILPVYLTLRQSFFEVGWGVGWVVLLQDLRYLATIYPLTGVLILTQPWLPSSARVTGVLVSRVLTV